MYEVLEESAMYLCYSDNRTALKLACYLALAHGKTKCTDTSVECLPSAKTVTTVTNS